MNDQFDKFLAKLKADKTPEEFEAYLTDILKFGSAHLYTTLMTELTDEDIAAIENISDDEKATEELKKRFQLRTGFTVEEFTEKVQEAISSGYLQNHP